MGCCISRPDGPNAPYPGGANGSGRAINNPPGGAAAAVGGIPRAGNGGRGAGLNAVDGAGDSDTPVSSAASSPSTIGSQRQHGAAAPPIPSNVSRLPPPQTALATHINKPIRRRGWASRDHAWTRQSIDRERTDFFDTRVTGRPEIWQALHTALNILWDADLVEAARRAQQEPASQSSPSPGTPAASGSTELAEALATAQTILDAADITLPSGNMAQGAYDTFGSFYPMPAWVVSDPTNLESDPQHDLDDETKGDAALSSASEGDDGDGDESDEETAGDNGGDGSSAGATTAQRQQRKNRIRSRREKKGKAVEPDDADRIAVRARLSTMPRDVVIRVGRDDTVNSLAHRITEACKLPANTRIRVAYMGRILKDGASLPAQGWKEGHVVNALVFDTP